MSDAALIAIVTSIQTVVLTVFGALIAIYQRRVAVRADDNRRRLDALAAATASLAETATSTHKLVNSWAIIQLRLLATAHRRLANVSNDVGDIRTAEDTEERLREEEKRQREVLK